MTPVRTLLRPSLWLWVGLASFWALRGLDVRARLSWGTPLDLADVISFAWDAGLTLGLFLLGRLWGGGANLAPARFSAFVRSVVLGALLFAAFFMRAADVLYCTLTGGHFNSSAFIYMTAENLPLLRDGHNASALAALVVAFVVCFAASVLDLRAHRTRAASLPALGRPLRLGMLGLAFASVLVPIGAGLGASEEQKLRFVPESVFIHEWLVWQGVLQAEDSAVLDLPPGLSARFRALGLLPAESQRPDYPLYRERLDTTPFPYPATAHSAERPNVVFTLLEQLNHEFVSAWSHELVGVMPELSRIAEHATMVTEYQSVTQPTINALQATLCSIHGAEQFMSLNRGRGGELLERTPLSCLPEILRDQGYRTVYIQGGDNSFAGTEGFLRAHGFSEVYGRPELLARFPNSEDSRWGLHDDTLSAFVQEKILQLEALRAKDGRPFFLMMQTIDMHSPGHPPSGCALPRELYRLGPDKDSRMMIRTLHCTDQVLGAFGRFLLGDPVRAARTLWALTGDHPSMSMGFLRKLHDKHGDKFRGWTGRLPLLLHDPMHALPRQVPVLSGHLDLAPTLLHMLGITEIPNAMSGHSIFGERRKFPLLLGRMAPKYAALYRPGKTVDISISRLAKQCVQQQPLIAGDPQALSSCELLAWLRWQNGLWQAKRIAPPPDTSPQTRKPSP